MKIKGIKKVVGDSKRLSKSAYGSNYFEVFYDKEKQALWYYEHTNKHSFLQLRENSDDVKVCNIYSPISMCELKSICIDKLANII